MSDENNGGNSLKEEGELSGSDEEPIRPTAKGTKAVGRHSTMLRLDGPSLRGRVGNISSILSPSEVEARNEAAVENDRNISYSMLSSRSIEFSDDAGNVEDNKNGSDHSASSSLPQPLGDITMEKLKDIDV